MQQKKASIAALAKVRRVVLSNSPQASAWGYGALKTHEPFQRFIRCTNESERKFARQLDWLETRKPLKRFQNIEPYRNPQAEAWTE